MISIPIDDQRGNSIRFSIDQSIGTGPFHYRLAILVGPLETLLPEAPIDGRWAPGNQTEGDLRTIAIKSVSQEASVPFLQINDRPGGSILNFLQVIPVNPGMPFTEPGKALGCESETTSHSSNAECRLRIAKFKIGSSFSHKYPPRVSFLIRIFFKFPLLGLISTRFFYILIYKENERGNFWQLPRANTKECNISSN